MNRIVRLLVLSSVLSLPLLLVSHQSAPALCGDVSGDEKVTTADALRVLKKSVGQNVTMTCEESPVEFVNYFGFANALTCNNATVKAQMTWSRHPSLTWSDYSQASLPFTVDFKRVDDSEISGVITLSFGACGSIVFDIDSWGVFYPMPASGGAWAVPYFEASTNTVFLLLELAPLETAALRHGESSSAVTILAAAIAPEGLSNSVTPSDWMTP